MEQSTINLENNDDDSPDQAYGNDFDTNRQYLTFSWWLLHRGWKEVMLKVEAAVKEVFGTLSIRDDVSMQRFSELTLEVRKKVEGATPAERQSSRWLQYLLPPKDQEDFVLKSAMPEDTTTAESSSISHPRTSSLRRLLDETSDLIDSPPFSHVLTLLLDAGFSTLVDQKIAQQAYNVPQTPDGTEASASRVMEIFDPRPAKLPKILAILTRQAHSIGNGVPNEYLQAIEGVRDLEAFAAVVYSSNWENEISPMDEEGSTVFVQKDIAEKPGSSQADDAAGQESVINVGAESTHFQFGTASASTFESAWGKAVSDNGEKEKGTDV